MITRKIFLRQLAGGGMTAMLWGCGGGGGSEEEEIVPLRTCGRFTITANHGHELLIPESDLDAAGDLVYSVQGSAPHTHSVTLTATQRAQLKAGLAINVTTSAGALDGHVHDVSGTCR